MSISTNSYQERLKDLRSNLKKAMPEKVLEVFDNEADELQVNHNSVLKLNIGKKAPEFSLSNSVGKTVSLSDLLKKGKIVLTFYRGNWCPYCNLQLAHYQKSLTEIQELGANFVAISPQSPDQSLSMKEKNELNFEVLSDNGSIIAKKFTTTFKNSDLSVETMTNLGIDFDSHYSDDSRELPVPAVFIIEQDGTISYAKSLGGDYRNRVDVSEIIASLKK